jgi:hypothetical protein
MEKRKVSRLSSGWYAEELEREEQKMKPVFLA